MKAQRPRAQRPIDKPASQRRNPRRLQEIIIAVFLTVAAVGFIVAALLRGEGPRGPSLEVARKPFADIPH